MKKLISTFVAATMIVVSMCAQNSQVASLTHGTDVTLFYGGFALQEAHEAAVSGDIINLSGGTFHSVKITKAVTLRGAGVASDSPTYIADDFEIRIPEDVTQRFTMEGIICTGLIETYYTNDLCFIKCQLNNFNFWSGVTGIRKSLFVNCKVKGGVSLKSGRDDVQFLNCYLNDFYMNTSGSTASFYNCILPNPSTAYDCQLSNCIFYGSGQSISLDNSISMYNCVAINYSNKSFDKVQHDCKTATFSDVFKNFTGTYTDSETFELTESAKTTFLGTDGSQVGLYGGLVPFDWTPSYPRITKLNVANKATADGKLSVEIEVNAAQ